MTGVPALYLWHKMIPFWWTSSRSNFSCDPQQEKWTLDPGEEKPCITLPSGKKGLPVLAVLTQGVRTTRTWGYVNVLSCTDWQFVIIITQSPSHNHHHTITITLSPSHNHHHTVTITQSPSHCHHHTVIITQSPSHNHHHCHHHTITITLSPSHSHHHTIIITQSSSHNHHHTVTITLCHVLWAGRKGPERMEKCWAPE